MMEFNDLAWISYPDGGICAKDGNILLRVASVTLRYPTKNQKAFMGAVMFMQDGNMILAAQSYYSGTDEHAKKLSYNMALLMEKDFAKMDELIIRPFSQK